MFVTVFILLFLTASAFAQGKGKGNVAARDTQGVNRLGYRDTVVRHWDKFKSDPVKFEVLQAKYSDWVDKAKRDRGRTSDTRKSDKRWTTDDSTECSVNADLNLFQGDIVLQERDVELFSQQGRNKRGIILNDDLFGTTYRWNTAVAWTMDPTIANDPAFATVVAAAIAFWQAESCVNFVQNANAADKLSFFKGDGCFSSIGHIGGTQGISIGNGCQYLGLTAHEIGHALGLFHEQARSDRNNYVTVQNDNIEANQLINFEFYPENYMKTYEIGYDYGSVMHYSPKAFALDSNKPTIVAKDPAYQNTMGQRIAPAFSDVKVVNMAYNCPSKCNPAPQCFFGGYADSRNCKQCKCPDGLSGNCKQVYPSSGTIKCGGELQATTDWQTVSVPVSASSSHDCYWLIMSAENSKVQLEFDRTASFNADCSTSCPDDFVEVKTGPDFQVMSPRYCCAAPTNTFTSSDNMMILINHATKSSGFTARYKQLGGSPVTTTTPVTSTTTMATTMPIVTTRGPPAKRPTPRITTPRTTQTTTARTTTTRTTTTRRTPHVTTPVSTTARTRPPPRCPRNQRGTWGPWGPWGACEGEPSCGACSCQKRSRTCRTAPSCPCIGESEQDKACNTRPCRAGQIDAKNANIRCCGAFMVNKAGNNCVRIKVTNGNAQPDDDVIYGNGQDE